MLHIKLGHFHLLAFGATCCICGQPFDLARTYLFCCSHGEEHIVCNNAVWDAFVFILRDTKFYVLHEQTYVLPPSSLQSSCWHVDIILSTDGHCTLANMVITNLTWIDMIYQVALFCGMVVTIAAQAKDGLYHNQHLIYTFLFLAIEVFGCLHWKTNYFHHWCVA